MVQSAYKRTTILHAQQVFDELSDSKLRFFFLNSCFSFWFWVLGWRKWATLESVLVLGMSLCIMAPIWRSLIRGWGWLNWCWGLWFVALVFLLLFLWGLILKLELYLPFERGPNSQTWKLLCILSFSLCVCLNLVIAYFVSLAGRILVLPINYYLVFLSFILFHGLVWFGFTN